MIDPDRVGEHFSVVWRFKRVCWKLQWPAKILISSCHWRIVLSPKVILKGKMHQSAVIVSQCICLTKTKKYKIHQAKEGAILTTKINSFSGCSKCYVISKSWIHWLWKGCAHNTAVLLHYITEEPLLIQINLFVPVVLLYGIIIILLLLILRMTLHFDSHLYR